MGKVVMPKNSALESEILAALKIYYDENGWLKNADFTDRLKRLIGADQYHSSYTKKVQMTSYYGFTEWEDFSKNTSPRRITDSGKRFYEAWSDGNQDRMDEEIMLSLENTIFGRNNCGCSDSDSDVDIPPLFVRTILKVGYLTYTEFAYLLWKMEDCAVNYTDAIGELLYARNQDNLVLSEEAKKYTDAKPIVMLIRWGFLAEEGKIGNSTKIVIARRILDKYKKRLEHLKIYNIDKFPNEDNIENKAQQNISADISPQWFEEKGKEFAFLDDDAKNFLMKFKMVFAPEKLQELSGKELLEYIFLNSKNKTNLCYILEFDSDCRMIFGSIKSGTSYKYGLHYSKKNDSWATGTSQNPVLLTEDQAIELGTQIRDYLIAGADIIADAGELITLEDYQTLYNDLNDITEGYVNRVWFMKYYTLLYPEIFPPIYSNNAQNTVLNKIGIVAGDNLIYRMGQIKLYVDKCNISNIVFSRTFWTYCNGDDNKGDDEQNDNQSDNVEAESTKDTPELKSCLDIVRKPRENKVHPINFIVYGAPGTGKTYSMVEYALAIIENKSINEFRKNNTDRAANVTRYKELVKVGQIVFTTFHQNYGYEEFIQGLRPDRNSETMAFKIVDGVFKVIADKALNDTEDKNFVIIIDEINRANISKVFGELITLIEEDKRWGELNETSATLQSGVPFAVPNNLYIVGTMNSADKSISLIDAALRRRFDFIEQKPDSSLVPAGVLRKVFDNINENLVHELDSTDLLVGHSYFMDKDETGLCGILNKNIIPLLYEYFYDNRKKVAALIKDAIDKSGANIEIVDEKVGRLSVKTKEE